MLEEKKKYMKFMENIKANKIKKNLEQDIFKKEKVEKELLIYGPIYNEFDQVNNLTFDIFQNNVKTNKVNVNSNIVINYSFNLKQSVKDLNVSINIFTESGQKITTISTLNHTILDDINDLEVGGKQSAQFGKSGNSLILSVKEGKSDICKIVEIEFRGLDNNQFLNLEYCKIRDNYVLDNMK